MIQVIEDTLYKINFTISLRQFLKDTTQGPLASKITWLVVVGDGVINAYYRALCAMPSHFSRVRLCDPMRCSLPAHLSMGFSRQEYWNGLPCPPQRDLPNPGCKPTSLTSPVLAGGFFTVSATWKALAQTYWSGISSERTWESAFNKLTGWFSCVRMLLNFFIILRW